MHVYDLSMDITWRLWNCVTVTIQLFKLPRHCNNTTWNMLGGPLGFVLRRFQCTFSMFLLMSASSLVKISLIIIIVVMFDVCRDSVRRRSSDILHEAIPSSDPIRTLSPALPPSLHEGQVGVCCFFWCLSTHHFNCFALLCLIVCSCHSTSVTS